MKKKCILFISFLLILGMAGCNLPQPASPGEAYLPGGGEPQAWIDAPLNESRLPLAPYEVVYHITGGEGAALGELSINEQVVASLPNPNPAKKLSTLKFLWEPTAPGEYLLSAHAQGIDGAWGPAAESVIFIGEKTSTVTPTPTLSDTPTPTSTLTATLTPTPASGFSNFSASPNAVYYGNCTPNQVTVNAQAIDPAGITTVVLFYRLRDENGNKTEWLNTAMNSKGNDQYSRTVDMKSLASQTGFTKQNATLEIQLVIQNTNTEMTRSPVYANVTVLACGGYSPRITLAPQWRVITLLPTQTPVIIK